uniref:Uncharacterized protein n=1 Tax=Strigamia maritima TaxID=126957 RepID=T1JAP0_STRMM
MQVGQILSHDLKMFFKFGTPEFHVSWFIRSLLGETGGTPDTNEMLDDTINEDSFSIVLDESNRDGNRYEDDDEIGDDDDSNAMPVPRVKLAADGSIIVDEQ